MKIVKILKIIALYEDVPMYEDLIIYNLYWIWQSRRLDYNKI